MICAGGLLMDVSEFVSDVLAWMVVVIVPWVCSGAYWLEERLDVRAMWSSSVSLNSSLRREISIPMRV